MQTISLELEVYSFQIDFMGHVSNIVYVQWMEIARAKLLDAIGLPLAATIKQGFAPVLVQTSITYKSPLYLGDRVRLELWLSELRQASAIMQFRFYNSQAALAAQGWQKGLFVDRATLQPKRLCTQERTLFTPYLHSQSEVAATSFAGAL